MIGALNRIAGLAAGLAVLALAASAPRADNGGLVDLELVLAVDSSSSVSEAEFALQIGGLAQAFQHPSVIEAIESNAPNGIAVTLMQWSGAGWQEQTVPFAHVYDAESAARLAAHIAASRRAIIGGPTALGAAIDFAARLMETNAYSGGRQVIDVSGDGVNNHGGSPVVSRARATARGVTINGLAILNEEPTLDRYYAARVIGGQGAFLITANNFEDYRRAIRIKLIREISGVPMT